MILKIFRELLESSSVHGLKYLIDKKLHWTERIFWVACLAVSCYCLSLLIMASWYAFRNNPISFVVETTYKDWETDFPSVAICETENSDKIEQASDSLWTAEHDFNLEEVLKEIAFYKGVSYYLLQFCSADSTEPNCPKANFTFYADAVRSSCEEMVTNCSWAGEPFECCKYFLPLDTEIGQCYAINSVQGRERNGAILPMVSNKVTGPGILEFDVLVPANVYILGEEEVPALTSISSDILTVAGQIHYRRQIAVRSIENDAAARDVSTEKRRCKYPDEDPPSVYRRHSYSACTVQCRKEAQIAACGCVSFFMPNTSKADHCKLEGLVCLHENYAQLSVLRASWSARPGLSCDCQPSCTETEISVIADDRSAAPYDYSHVELALIFLPSERFRRNVVRAPLDLVVSMGGTSGLFLGASILTFVEFPYYLLVRGINNIFFGPKKTKVQTKSSKKSTKQRFAFVTKNTKLDRLQVAKKTYSGVNKQTRRNGSSFNGRRVHRVHVLDYARYERPYLYNDY